MQPPEINQGVNAQRMLPVALLTAVAAISFAAIFFRLAAPTHPLVAAGLRLAIASVLIAPMALRAARVGRITRRLAKAAALGGLLYGLHFGTWVWSLTLTSVAASVTLVTATPLLLGVIALATGRDRPDRHHWFAIGLAIVGLSVIGGHDLLAGGSSALIGDGLAIAGATAMAGYLLVGRRMAAEMDVWGFTWIAVTVGAIVLCGFASAAGLPLEAASDEALLWIALAALLPQLVGHTLLTWSLGHARPTVVGMATVGEPVGSTILAFLWLGESVSAAVLVGCAITLCAVVLALRHQAPASGSDD